MQQTTPRSNPARTGAVRPAMLWLVGIVSLVGGVLAMMLYNNITQRKHEASSNVVRIVELNEKTIDPAE